MRVPDALHPIDIEANPARVVVRRGGTTVAETANALTLREAHYPPVQYVPLEDVKSDLIRPSNHTSYCPFKGEASYYDLVVDGEVVPHAIWTYQDPYPAMAQIKGYVAFYAHHVQIAADSARSDTRLS